MNEESLMSMTNLKSLTRSNVLISDRCIMIMTNLETLMLGGLANQMFSFKAIENLPRIQ